MAGHSKWANIKHTKGKQDAKRGKVFTKLIREITVAARLGGADPGSNPRLRTAVEKGLGHNLPKDTIQRAIKRGGGNEETDQLVDVRYEGYGPGGVAIIVDCLTDNKNRTVADVRHLFTKHGGNLGTAGSVTYLFKKMALIHIKSDLLSENDTMDMVLETGAEDFLMQEDGSITILTAPETTHLLQQELDRRKIPDYHTDIIWMPSTPITLFGEAQTTINDLIESLEDLDDVQHVYTNIEPMSYK